MPSVENKWSVILFIIFVLWYRYVKPVLRLNHITGKYTNVHSTVA